MKNDKQTVLFYFLLKHHKHGWLKQVRVQFSNSIIVVEPHHFWKVESKTSWLDWSNCICEVCVKVAPTRVHKRFSLSFFFFFQIRCQVCRCLNISHVTRVWHEQRRCHFSVTFPHFFRKCSSEQRPVVTDDKLDTRFDTHLMANKITLRLELHFHIEFTFLKWCILTDVYLQLCVFNLFLRQTDAFYLSGTYDDCELVSFRYYQCSV